jgi:serine/threonine-protein kinase RsbW
MAATRDPEDALGSATHHGDTSRPGQGGHGIQPARPMRLRLPAETIAPSVARHQLRRWLADLVWPPAQTQDIVLAVSEAVANSVEHAYADQPPGAVDLNVDVEILSGGQRRATLVILDEGRWRPAPADDENRRRGIPMMRACMGTVTIEVLSAPDGRPRGTRVTMISRTVPPPAE